MMTTKFKFLFASLALAGITTLSAQTVGYVTVTIPANSTRSVAIPLNEAPSGNGQVTGMLTGVGSNYLENANAGWTPSAFSSTSNPHYIRIKSGNNAGKIFLVLSTANTATRIFVNNESTDLTTLGFNTGTSGDTYEICTADTLLGLFGATTLQGGTSPTTADNVQVWGGASFLTFYYNTTWARWARDTDIISSASRDTFVLRPDRGLFVIRRAATAVDLVFTGRVPDANVQFRQTRPGTTFINTGLPVDNTLAGLALQLNANNPGWVGWSDYTTANSNADLIEVWGGASWLTFFYHSTNNRWQRTGEVSQTDRSTFSIPAGRPIMVTRRTAGGDGFAKIILPYTP